MKDAGADGLLHLLANNPTLLDPAPAGANLGPAMERRRQDEVRTCLRCGGRARCAYVGVTRAGNRWLDLCWACSDWLIRTATLGPLASEAM